MSTVLEALKGNCYVVLGGLPSEKRRISVITVPIALKHSESFANLLTKTAWDTRADKIIISKVPKHSMTCSKNTD